MWRVEKMLMIHRIIYNILYPIIEIVCKIEETAQTRWEYFGMLYDSSYLVKPHPVMILLWKISPLASLYV